MIGLATARVELSRHGPLGTGLLFGNRSGGTGSPKSPIAENVQLRVGPYPRATLITSDLTAVSGRFSCNTRTPKAYVFVTTTLIGIKRNAAMRLGFRTAEGIIGLHPFGWRSCMLQGGVVHTPMMRDFGGHRAALASADSAYGTKETHRGVLFKSAGTGFLFGLVTTLDGQMGKPGSPMKHIRQQPRYILPSVHWLSHPSSCPPFRTQTDFWEQV